MTSDGSLSPGTILEVELCVPPKTGVLEDGGKIRTLARVLRLDSSTARVTEVNGVSPLYTVASQFCQRPIFAIDY